MTIGAIVTSELSAALAEAEDDNAAGASMTPRLRLVHVSNDGAGRTTMRELPIDSIAADSDLYNLAGLR